MSAPSAQRSARGARRLQDCTVVLLGGTAGVGLEAACRFAEGGVVGICLLGRDAWNAAGAPVMLSESATATRARP